MPQLCKFQKRLLCGLHDLDNLFFVCSFTFSPNCRSENSTEWNSRAPVGNSLARRMGCFAFLFSKKSGIRGEHSVSLRAAAAIILLLLLLCLLLHHLSYQIINCEAVRLFCKFGQQPQLGPCPNVCILSHVFHLVKVLVYRLAIIIGNSLFERVIIIVVVVIIIIKCCCCRCCRRRHCLHAKSLYNKRRAIRLSPAVAYY
jgi:hypothetical protein